VVDGVVVNTMVHKGWSNQWFWFLLWAEASYHWEHYEVLQ